MSLTQTYAMQLSQVNWSLAQRLAIDANAKVGGSFRQLRNNDVVVRVLLSTSCKVKANIDALTEKDTALLLVGLRAMLAKLGGVIDLDSVKILDDSLLGLLLQKFPEFLKK